MFWGHNNGYLFTPVLNVTTLTLTFINTLIVKNVGKIQIINKYNWNEKSSVKNLGILIPI